MTVSIETEPWRDLPPELASLIEPQLARASEEILVAIAREVPEYARPLEGSFGRGLRTGVNEALHEFVDLIREPDAGRAHGHEVYRELGRGELRQGRTLDSLQSAYRVGARIAWRRMADAAATEVDSKTLSRLAEAIFAYIDRLAADSVEGFAEEMAQREDERGRRREELTAMIVRDDPSPSPTALQAAAESARWSIPTTAAAVACPAEELDLLRRRLPQDAITGNIDGIGCAIVSDPAGPTRERELIQASRESLALLGPVVAPDSLASSWRLASSALELRLSGQLGDEPGLIEVNDLLDELLFHQAHEVVSAIADQRLGPLMDLPPGARERIEETALAYVQHSGNAAAMARTLQVHPQTIRHRLPRLRELLGDQIDDSKARLGLEVALRSRLSDRHPAY